MTDAHEVLFEPTQLLTDRYLFMMNSGMAKFSVTCGKNESIIALSNVKTYLIIDSTDLWNL